MELFIKKGTPAHRFDRHWQFGIGSDHASQMLRKDYCEQVKLIHDVLGIRYIRFHGIFCDDMDTVQSFEDVLGIPGTDRLREWSFRKCGQVYDNVLDCGMKPFVELSFMPSPLAKDKTPHRGLYGANTNMPENLDEWARFITAFIRYLLHRYGEEEVKTWYFEIWNEPDLQHPFFKGTQKDYFALYDVTARAVKEVCPDLRVGGPATSGSHWVGDFVRHCRENNIPADFVSTHQYVGDPFIGVSAEPAETAVNILTPEEQAARNREFFASFQEGTPLLEILRKLFGDPTREQELDRDVFVKNAELTRKQTDGLPLYYDEWNMCATFSAYSNDTRKQAAYLVRTALNMEGKADGTCVWCVSDIFEELHQFSEEFHGGFGLLTQGGIKKTSFHALKMLADVGDNRLEVSMPEGSEVEAAAFCGGDGMQILLYRQNLKQPDLPAEPVSVSVELDRAPYEVTLQRIDETHCNPLKLWEDMGSPADLRRAEIENLKQRSEMQTETPEWQFENGVFRYEAELQVNDVYLIRLRLVP